MKINITLKELRKKKKLTQTECSKYLGIPNRTYQNYENDITKQDSMKYYYMIKKLEQYGLIDETHGILTIKEITDICSNIFSTLDVQYCYLFGSYAKGSASESSDIDLLISTSITGMQFYDLVESLREYLKKKVDLLTVDQLKDNLSLTNKILKDGIKIYG